MGSQRECTRILGLEGFRVETIEWEAGGPRARMRIWIERCGIRGMNVLGVDDALGGCGMPRNGRGTICPGRRTW